MASSVIRHRSDPVSSLSNVPPHRSLGSLYWWPGIQGSSLPEPHFPSLKHYASALTSSFRFLETLCACVCRLCFCGSPCLESPFLAGSLILKDPTQMPCPRKPSRTLPGRMHLLPSLYLWGPFLLPTPTPGISRLVSFRFSPAQTAGARSGSPLCSGAWHVAGPRPAIEVYCKNHVLHQPTEGDRLANR